MLRFRGILSSEKGTISILMALSLTAVAGFGALGVDYGYLQWKRSQLQTAADSAALAGVDALVAYKSTTSPPTTQIQSAVKSYVTKNMQAADKPDKATTNNDIAIDLTAGSVEVTVGMTALRGNPVSLVIGRMLGIPTADVTVKAKAAAYCIGEAKCLKPWSPPAKFTWNDACDASHTFKNNGVFDTASACEKASVQVLGYTNADRGVQIVLKQGDPSTTVAPGQYGPVDYPAVNRGNPLTGGSVYRDNICRSSTDCGCPSPPGSGSTANDVFVTAGDYLQLEPGNLTGPTKQGVDDLVAQDAGAQMVNGVIVNSAYGNPMNSPRVVLLPFYDPRDPPTSGRNSIRIYQIGLVFIEGLNQGSGDITARFIEAVVPVKLAKGSTSGTDCLAKGIRLVRDSSRS